MKNSIVFAVLSIWLLLSACSTQKNIYKAPIKEEGEEYLISKMKANESKFTTFKSRALITVVNDGRLIEMKANIRMRQDSAIWVSLTVGIGLEAARILLTKDSVLFINRLEKTFFAGNYDFVNQMINAKVDFDIIQALLTGNDFKWYDYQDLKAKVLKGQYQLESTHRRKLKKYVRNTSDDTQIIYQCMWLNSENFKIERIRIKEIKNESKKINAEYSKFKDFDGQLLPTQYDIKISADKAVEIDATLTRIKLNEALKFPFNIPSKYEEIKMPK